MATSLTRNLRLRLSSDLSADSIYNLNKLDTLGATYVVDTTEQLRIRSAGDILLEAQSPDVGGAGEGGQIFFGTPDNPASLVQFYADLLDVGTALAFPDQGAGGTKYLQISYKSDLDGATDTAANRVLQVDLQAASRNLILGGNFQFTGGNLVLTLGANTSLTLPAAGTLSTLAGTEILSGKTFSDALRVSAAGFTTSLDASASAASNLEFTLPSTLGSAGQVLSSDGSGNLDWLTVTGTGTVVGPVSSTDNALPRWNGVAGTALQNSLLVVSDTGDLTGLVDLTYTGDLTTPVAVSRVLATDSSGVVSATTATPTEAGYLSGVTSGIQAQLDAKSTTTGTETLQNKTLDNTNTVVLLDTEFTLQDSTTPTKQVVFELSGLTSATTRTLTVPDADLTLVGAATTQNLTNKTLDNSNILTLRDDRLTLQDSGDATKQAVFQLSGVNAGATRIISVPDLDLTLLGTTSTQLVQNKTVDITNSLTALDSTFLVESSATPGRTLQFDLSNLTSSRTLFFPNTNGDVLVATELAQTLTNKTLASPVVSGSLALLNTSGSQATLQMYEDPDSGSNFLGHQAAATMGSNYTLTWPAAQASGSQALTNNGSGTLAWTSVVENSLLTTRGQLIRRGASAPEAFSAVTNNRVVRGDGTDVVLGQIDSANFFTTGAEVTQSLPGVVKSAGQLLGTNTNDSAAAGYVGEYISSTVAAPVNPASSDARANLTSISLSAGDWLVYFGVYLDKGSSTGNTYILAGVSLTSAATDVFTGDAVMLTATTATLATPGVGGGPRRVTVANGNTQTVHLVGALSYTTVGTATWSIGSKIWAVRVR